MRAEARNQGDALIHAVRETIAAPGVRIDAATIAGFEADSLSLSKALAGTDALVIQAQSVALDAKAKKRDAQAAVKPESTGAPADQSGQAGTHGDNRSAAVDAEFKEVEQR